MFNCNGCLSKLREKRLFSCAHVLCHGCVFVDENGKAVCPIDKKSVRIENNDDDDNFKTTKSLSEEIKTVDKQLEKEFAVVKFVEDKLLLRKEINDIVQVEKKELKCVIQKIFDDISESVREVKKTLCELSVKVENLEAKQEYHRKKYDNQGKKSLALKYHYRTYDLSCSKSNYVHFLKLENFSKLTRNARLYFGEEIIFSESFICALGYQMCLLVCPYGIGSARGYSLSVYFQIMEGPNDDELTWPAVFNVKFKLIDQWKDEKHHYLQLPRHKSVIYSPTKFGDTRCRGEKNFIALNKLEPYYLVDDTICLEVVVDFF